MLQSSNNIIGAIGVEVEYLYRQRWPDIQHLPHRFSGWAEKFQTQGRCWRKKDGSPSSTYPHQRAPLLYMIFLHIETENFQKGIVGECLDSHLSVKWAYPVPVSSMVVKETRVLNAHLDRDAQHAFSDLSALGVWPVTSEMCWRSSMNSWCSHCPISRVDDLGTPKQCVVSGK